MKPVQLRSLYTSAYKASNTGTRRVASDRFTVRIDVLSSQYWY